MMHTAEIVWCDFDNNFINHAVYYTPRNEAVEGGMLDHCVRPFSGMIHKWSLACEGVSRLMVFDLDLYLLRHSRHDFAIKLIKYGASCRVRYTACTVLDGFFSYLAQMIISIKGCVVCNNLWPWPIFSRSFCPDFAIKQFWLNYFLILRKRSPRWEGV